jgi:hypothetical protein
MKLEDIILFSMDLYVIHTLSLWMDSSTPPESEVPLEKLTKQQKLVKRSYSHLCVQRSKIVERKIMLYPAPTNRHKPAFYISTDTKKTTFNQNLTLSHHTRATHKHFTPLQLRSSSAPSPVTVKVKAGIDAEWGPRVLAPQRQLYHNTCQWKLCWATLYHYNIHTKITMAMFTKWGL